MSGSTAFWYASRATGIVALLLLTAVLVLGILVNRQGRLPGLPRFAVTDLHRNLSLLSVAFIVIHVFTAVQGREDVQVSLVGCHRFELIDPLIIQPGEARRHLRLAALLASTDPVALGFDQLGLGLIGKGGLHALIKLVQEPILCPKLGVGADGLLVGGELAESGMIRKPALARLIADDCAGREDRSKQIWQLLTLELWYRNAQSMGVAA